VPCKRNGLPDGARHADHRAVTHGYAVVMERSLASTVLDGGGIGVSVTGTFMVSDGEVATHIIGPKPTPQPSAFVSAFRGRAAAPLIEPRGS
jgi:hypothetical protein